MQVVFTFGCCMLDSNFSKCSQSRPEEIYRLRANQLWVCLNVKNSFAELQIVSF